MKRAVITNPFRWIERRSRNRLARSLGFTDAEQLRERLGRLEAESEIRRTAARYFQICDSLGPDTPFTELGELFAGDACWEGKGRYEQAFGRYLGRDAIVDMIRSYCEPRPHFAMTAHFLTAESIAAQGNEANASWLMLQTSTYTDGTSDLRSAALSLQFGCRQGRWQITRFSTQNLFSRRVDRWSDSAAIPVPVLPNCGAGIE